MLHCERAKTQQYTTKRQRRAMFAAASAKAREIEEFDPYEVEEMGTPEFAVCLNRAGDTYIEVAAVLPWETPMTDECHARSAPGIREKYADWLSEHRAEIISQKNKRPIAAVQPFDRYAPEEQVPPPPSINEICAEAVLDYCRYVRVRFLFPDESVCEAQYDLDTNRGVNAWRNDSRKHHWELVNLSMIGCATAQECWA